MGCAPGLYPFRIYIETGGNLVQFLGYENELEGLSVDGLDVGVARLHVFFHIGLEIFTDDIDYFAESGFNCIVNGIVDDGFPVGTQAVHLLESAVAAAHSGCKDKKCRFHN